MVTQGFEVGPGKTTPTTGAVHALCIKAPEGSFVPVPLKKPNQTVNTIPVYTWNWAKQCHNQVAVME